LYSPSDGCQFKTVLRELAFYAMDSFGDASDSFADLAVVDGRKVNPFSYGDSFADNSNDYAEVPEKYNIPKTFDDSNKKRNFEDLQVFDVDECTSISLDDSEDDADPDPAFEINKAAAQLYKKRRSELQAEKKKINILQLHVQESKRQRLLQLKGTNPKVLSKSEKAALKLIERKEAGVPVDRLYLQDTENVITIVCESYTQDKVEELLGENCGWDHCFGCSFAVGSVKMEESPLTALNNYIAQIWGGGEAEIESILISYFYEKKIRTPYNKNYKGHGKPLPPWSARHIFECLSYHRIVGHNEMWRTTTLRGLCHDQKHLEKTKYAYPAYIAEQEREPNQRDFFISPEKHKMHMDIIKAQVMVRRAKFDAKPAISGVNAPIHFRDHNAAVISVKANLLAGSAQTKMVDWTKVKKGI
jgi:hypothetical protein